MLEEMPHSNKCVLMQLQKGKRYFCVYIHFGVGYSERLVTLKFMYLHLEIQSSGNAQLIPVDASYH